MTPEQVQEIVQQALGSQPPWYLTLVLAAVIGAAVAWIGPYLGQRAKILALQSDIRKLIEQARETTRATEAIRAQISAGVWVEQERWSLKRDIYCRLLEALGEFIWLKRFSTREGSVEARRTAIRTLYRDVVRAHSSGRMFLGSRSFELVALFAERLERFCLRESDDGDYSEVAQLAWNAFMALVEEAGADLMALRPVPLADNTSEP